MGSSTNGVARGQLRPYIGSRGPPFVICGLFIFLLIVGYSYWNLSFRFNILNSDFINLEEKLRVSATKNDQLMKQNEALSVSIQKDEAEIQRIRSVLSKKDDELVQAFNQLRSKEDEIGRLNSQVETLKPEVDKYKQAYDEVKVVKDQLNAEVRELKEKLSALQQKTDTKRDGQEGQRNSLNRQPDSKVPSELSVKSPDEAGIKLEIIPKKEQEQKVEVPLDPNVDIPKNII